MKTYYLNFNENDQAIFVNEEDPNDILFADEILRFGTMWTGDYGKYKGTEGFFEGCNCFRSLSYSIDFYRLSDCGEQLTNF